MISERRAALTLSMIHFSCVSSSERSERNGSVHRFSNDPRRRNRLMICAPPMSKKARRKLTGARSLACGSGLRFTEQHTTRAHTQISATLNHIWIPTEGGGPSSCSNIGLANIDENESIDIALEQEEIFSVIREASSSLLKEGARTPPVHKSLMRHSQQIPTRPAASADYNPTRCPHQRQPGLATCIAVLRETVAEATVPTDSLMRFVAGRVGRPSGLPVVL